MKIRHVAFVLFAVGIVSPAGAAEPSYVGVWGSNRAQCRLGQDNPNAPMAVRARSYDQHEAHCTFASVTSAGASWNVRANCSVEGDKQRTAFQLSVRGNRLIMTSGGSARTLTRCR